MNGLPLWISVPRPVSPDLADQIDDDLGIFPVIRPAQRGWEQAPEYVLIVTALTAFLTGMAEHYGADAAERLKLALTRLRRASAPPVNELMLHDNENSIRVVVDGAALADERAMPALLALERDVYRSGVVLRWDRAIGQWRATRDGGAAS